MVNARRFEKARLAFLFTILRHFVFLNFENETMQVLKDIMTLSVKQMLISGLS